MEKKYNHKAVEEKIYKMWEEGGYFTPKIDSAKEPYTIVLPPPNSNGKLHVGHALLVAIEDLLIRWKRMQGYSALWIPGTDHAGFETQTVFEKHLKKDGKSRLDFDRETLYGMVYDFVREQGDVIYEQIRSLGPSLDWTRKKFTLDEDVIETVYATFARMVKEGLVYRDDYMVNYCTFCGTTLSDLEVEYKEKNSPLYYVKYKLIDRKETEPEYLVVATTRPEPIYVDTHLAVNPEDSNMRWLLGRFLENPLTSIPMEVIADSFVDPEFGTGLVKLTPAHDKNDYEVAKKSGLPIVKAIGVDGKMVEYGTDLGLTGLYAKQGRKRVVELLEEKSLIDHIDENYQNSSAICYKCKNSIEPMVLPNWFVKVETLKKPAHDAVKNGDVHIYPDWQATKYHRWMEDMYDWPISRQIVWGIRIPAWYDVTENPDLNVTFLNSAGETITGKVSIVLEKYTIAEITAGLQTLIAPNNSKFVVQAYSPGETYLPETDTFDTWFSSGHWPLVTLGYPDSADFKYFYPTAVLETGWEILRFWVSRMIMFGIYLTGKPPFKDVYLHGLVRASDGRKMSKSLGNQVDPLDYVEEYGADALRMGLISGTAGGKDFSFPHDKVLSYRNFANKLWNMCRFMNMMFDEYIADTGDAIMWLDPSGNSMNLQVTDREILEKLNSLIISVNENLEKYKFAQAGEDLYHFMWDDLASTYIETIKDRDDKEVALAVLRYVFIVGIKMLHPFMPFVTEEIWSHIPGVEEKPLMTASWPKN